jgi:hypothetical protein
MFYGHSQYSRIIILFMNPGHTEKFNNTFRMFHVTGSESFYLSKIFLAFQDFIIDTLYLNLKVADNCYVSEKY